MGDGRWALLSLLRKWCRCWAIFTVELLFRDQVMFAPLCSVWWGAGGVIPGPDCLGSPHQKVLDQVAEGCVHAQQAQLPSQVQGKIMLNAELKSMNSILMSSVLFIQIGEC